jgi:cytochrome c oxidase assembly factor CtaG
VSPFEPGDLLTAWTADPFGLSLVTLVLVAQVALLVQAGRDGVRWPRWRVAVQTGLGVGTLAYALCGPLAVYRADVFWVGALQVGVLATVTPVGLALGDPVGLLRAAHPDGDHALLRAVHGRLVRALTYPAVSTALATGTLLLVFVTPVFVVSTRSAAAAAALDVVLLGTGLLFTLPLLTDDLLPRWATPPVRTLLAFLDGLLDAVPGIVVMTASTLLVPGYPGFSSGVSGLDPLLDQHLGGGALLATAESVGLPVIAAVFVEWMRSDEREAHEADRTADALEARRPATVPSTANGPPPGEAMSPSGLWWENDPRFAGRFRRAPGSPDDAARPATPEG